jgi:hypothetical protein
MEDLPSADDIQVGGSHYKDMGMQPWTVMQVVLTPEEFRGYLKGNVIKYSMRAGKKPDSDDAGKAVHYRAKLDEFNATGRTSIVDVLAAMRNAGIL